MKTRKIYLRAPVQEMAAHEVTALIGEERYGAIKARDSHPFFVAFSAGHEGESRGRVLGRGPAGSGTAKRWSAERIRELAGRLNQAPVYLFHNADNSPRRQVGEIVAGLARTLRGKLHALAVAYIADPEARERIQSGELDACSIEAELEFSRRGRHRTWLVEAVRKVTGLALGSRAVVSPGFPDASLLAVVQEFEPEPEKNMRRLEQQLQNRELRIRKLEEELGRLRPDAEKHRLSAQVEAAVSARLAGRNLSRDEADLIAERVREFALASRAGAAALDRLVEERVRKELESLDRLRRLYAEAGSYPLPPEPDGENRAEPWRSNPLIPAPTGAGLS